MTALFALIDSGAYDFYIFSIPMITVLLLALVQIGYEWWNKNFMKGANK
jgi:hypothetical protein